MKVGPEPFGSELEVLSWKLGGASFKAVVGSFKLEVPSFKS